MHLSLLHCLATTAVFSGVASAFPAGFDAAADFSPTLNPNGVWSFGFQTTLGSGFTLETVSGNTGGVDHWLMGPDLPGAFHNPTGSTINFATVNINPGQLLLHPGPSGEFSLCRFTVPAGGAGSYQFSADFIGQDFAYPTSTDVHLLVNGVSVYDDLVNSYNVNTSSGVFTMTLAVGDTIDAAVGMGTNNNYYGDSTGLTFLVAAVPTPGAAALVGLGGLVSLRRRRV